VVDQVKMQLAQEFESWDALSPDLESVQPFCGERQVAKFATIRTFWHYHQNSGYKRLEGTYP
jgi:hypothetical protein